MDCSSTSPWGWVLFSGGILIFLSAYFIWAWGLPKYKKILAIIAAVITLSALGYQWVKTTSALDPVITFIWPEPQINYPHQLSPSDLLLINQALAPTPLWSKAFIYFGYTFCPDVCPTTLTELSKLRTNTKHSFIKEIPFIFVTVDPERDKPERLKEYLSFFGSNIYFLALSATEVKELSSHFGAKYKIQKTDDLGNNLIDHSADVYLVNNLGQVLTQFEHPINQNSVESFLLNHLN